MYEPHIHLLACTLSASEYELEHAHTDVLKQLFDTARSRVTEQRQTRRMNPNGHIMIKITVEQWCEDMEADEG